MGRQLSTDTFEQWERQYMRLNGLSQHRVPLRNNVRVSRLPLQPSTSCCRPRRKTMTRSRVAPIPGVGVAVPTQNPPFAGDMPESESHF